MGTEIIFEVKKEHLALLKQMCVGWQDCEFGAPEIDPKRPYGNSGVHQDMIKILGTEVKHGIFKIDICGKEYYITPKEDSEDMNELEKILNTLHRETETVLQIALQNGMLKEGKYKLKDKYSDEWEYIGD
jgi:hypothetical protein